MRRGVRREDRRAAAPLLNSRGALRNGAFPLHSGLLLFAFLLLAPAAFAAASKPQAMPQDDTYPTGADAGRALAAEMSNIRLESGEWKGDLKIQRHGADGRKTTFIPAMGQSLPGDTEWKTVYQTVSTNGIPAETLTVIHATNAPNRYLYARAAAPGAPPGEAKTLGGAEIDMPLAGTDFWLSDLGLEFFHWPGQNRLPGEFMRNRSCFKLESTNPNPEPGGYSRVVTWIDKETGGPMQADAYGADGKKLKQFEVGHFEKVNGQYQVKDMAITDLRTGSKTTLEFELPAK